MLLCTVYFRTSQTSCKLYNIRSNKNTKLSVQGTNQSTKLCGVGKKLLENLSKENNKSTCHYRFNKFVQEKALNEILKSESEMQPLSLISSQMIWILSQLNSTISKSFYRRNGNQIHSKKKWLKAYRPQVEWIHHQLSSGFWIHLLTVQVLLPANSH